MASLLLLARLSALIVAGLVLIRALAFKTSFLPHSSSQDYLISAVALSTLKIMSIRAQMHASSLVIGFILVGGECPERTRNLENNKKGNFGAQVVAEFKEYAEIGAFIHASGGSGTWVFWDLDKVSWQKWDHC
ncbi:unnamed protein product [Thlaspi arvense]|uniref:Uncharacterized protein n=1 Tax=Thlaspi arvense TaxID=13288 RepID=A0AAU9RSS8_THLAR|nr:unnamed protein product [Thlaspi arvense]